MFENTETVNAVQEVVVAPDVVESTPEIESVEQKQSADDNAKYAAARREAESEAKQLREKVARLEQAAKKGGYESVESFTEAYEQTLSQELEQRRREDLENRGIDPDQYDSLVMEHPLLKEANEIKTKYQQEESRKSDMYAFLDYFKQLNGRPFDSDTDTISEEVSKMASDGIPLIIAYKAVEETNTLRKELADLKEQLTANKTNETNAQTSTGSVSQTVSDTSDYVSKESFEQNKSNSDWMKRNLDKILKSRPKWR